MLTKLSVGNIRLFADNDWTFQIRPLTVLCGTNSSGKSTLLKTMAVLAQTISARSSSLSSQGHLVTSGPLADVGSYGAFVSNNELSRPIRISIELSRPFPATFIEEFRACTREGESPDSEEPRTSTGTPCTIAVDMVFGCGARMAEGAQQELFEGDSGKIAENQDVALRQAAFRFGIGDEVIMAWRVVDAASLPIKSRIPSGYFLQIPRAFMERFTSSEMDLHSHVSRDLVELEASIRGFLPERVYVGRARTDERDRHSRRVTRYVQFGLPPLLDDITYAISRSMSLDRLLYLGPMRTPSQRYYLTRGRTEERFDAEGMFALKALHSQGGQRVRFPDPSNPSDVKRAPLLHAVGEWLHYLRTGQSGSMTDPQIAVENTKNVLLECRLRGLQGSQLHSIADSGFGYSQVIPIIVGGILANPGSLLLVEQPELHLNPALQVRLAFFFAALALHGKQSVLETHSEHFVNSTRALVAERQLGSLEEKVIIHYLGEREGELFQQELTPLADGSVRNWPREFFGEALDLSKRMLRAQKHHLREED